MAKSVYYTIGRLYGCYLHYAASIASDIALPHPVGVVIGEGAAIGSGCRIYQNVTIGAKREGKKGYPTLGKGCEVYAGAVIIGPVHIGAFAVVGANSVVLTDIPSGEVWCGIPAKPLKSERPLPQLSKNS